METIFEEQSQTLKTEKRPSQSAFWIIPNGFQDAAQRQGNAHSQQSGNLKDDRHIYMTRLSSNTPHSPIPHAIVVGIDQTIICCLTFLIPIIRLTTQKKQSLK